MPEDELLRPAVPDALNHGGVVPGVRVDLAACAKHEKPITASEMGGGGTSGGSVEDSISLYQYSL